MCRIYAHKNKISENPHLIINILLCRERMRVRAPTPRSTNGLRVLAFSPIPTQCKPIIIKDKQEINSKYLMSHLFVNPPSFQCLKRCIHEVTDNFRIPDRKCKQTNSQSICGHLIQSVIKSCRLPDSLMKTSPIDPK